jgi:hypothetical protein
MRPFIPPALRTFDPPETDAEPPVDHTPLRDAAFAEGHDAGLRAGHAAGLAEGEARMRAIADAEIAELRSHLDRQAARRAVAAALSNLLEQRDADITALAAAARSALAEALQGIFPVFLRTAMGAEVAALLTDAAEAHSAEQLKLRAAPATIDAVRGQSLPDELLARITFVPVPDRPPGWADIAWSGGGLTFDPDALLWQVADLLSYPIAKNKDKTDE